MTATVGERGTDAQPAGNRPGVGLSRSRPGTGTHCAWVRLTALEDAGQHHVAVRAPTIRSPDRRAAALVAGPSPNRRVRSPRPACTTRVFRPNRTSKETPMKNAVTSMLRVPGGRRTKFVVIGVWLLVAVAIGPLSGKF